MRFLEKKIFIKFGSDNFLKLLTEVNGKSWKFLTEKFFQNRLREKI